MHEIRYGFATEKDYNDNESYCGGLSVQHQQNGGKCGVCGDPYHMPQVLNKLTFQSTIDQLNSIHVLRVTFLFIHLVLFHLNRFLINNS